jgi:hypothetical protein
MTYLYIYYQVKKDKNGYPAPSDNLQSKTPTALKLINILTCLFIHEFK